MKITEISEGFWRELGGTLAKKVGATEYAKKVNPTFSTKTANAMAAPVTRAQIAAELGPKWTAQKQAATATATNSPTIKRPAPGYVNIIDIGEIRLYYNGATDVWRKLHISDWGPNYESISQQVPSNESDTVATKIARGEVKQVPIPGTTAKRKGSTAKRKGSTKKRRK